MMRQEEKRIGQFEDYSISVIRSDDAGQLAALAGRNREYLRRWLTWVDHLTTEAHFRMFIEGACKRYSEGTELPCVIRSGDDIIGRIGLYQIDTFNKTASVGYWIGASEQGKGVITRSCAAVIRYGFESMQLNRIEIRCATSNTRSAAIPQRLEFAHEGVLQEAEYINGRFQDLDLYAITRRTWCQAEPVIVF